MPLIKEEIDHLNDLIKASTKRLRALETKQAELGTECPPHMVVEIQDVKEKIAQYKDTLNDSEVIAEEIYNTTKARISEDIPLAFDNQELIYHYLCNYVVTNHVSSAVLLQYSGRRATPLILLLLQRGADVTLYIQNPKMAVSQRQIQRIKSTIKELPDEIQLRKDARLRIIYYDTPPSFRGANIDNKVLAIGNYLFEYCNDQIFRDDKIAISGHDIPGLLLHEGSQWHAMYNKMFNDLIANYAHAKKKPKIDTAHMK